MAEQFNVSEKLGSYRSSALYALIFVGILLVFSLAIILPYSHSLKRADEEIVSLKEQLAKQEMQYPLYQALVKELRERSVENLTFAERGTLDKDDISKISAIMKSLADTHGMLFGRSVPDINSMINNKGMILVDVMVEGTLAEFREFINGLSAIPYLQDIEEIKIQPMEKNRQFSLKIWLAVE